MPDRYTRQESASDMNEWHPAHEKGAELATEMERRLREILKHIPPTKELPKILVCVMNLLCDCCAPGSNVTTSTSESAIEFRYRRAVMAVLESSVRFPLYCEAYSVLCQYISQQFPNFRPVLRQCLLNELERMLVRWSHIDLASNDQETLLAEKLLDFGLVQLVGELYKKYVISDAELKSEWLSIMWGLVDTSELAMEIFAKFIQVVGETLETTMPNELNHYFADFIDALHKHSKSLRMLVLIRDLIELRQRHWKPKQYASSNGC